MFKVNCRNTRTRCELFKVDNKDTTNNINDVVLVSLLSWTYCTPCFSVSIFNFELAIAGWAVLIKVEQICYAGQIRHTKVYVSDSTTFFYMSSILLLSSAFSVTSSILSSAFSFVSSRLTFNFNEPNDEMWSSPPISSNCSHSFPTFLILDVSLAPSGGICWKSKILWKLLTHWFQIS